MMDISATSVLVVAFLYFLALSALTHVGLLIPYVVKNPVNLIDPTGTSAESIYEMLRYYQCLSSAGVR